MGALIDLEETFFCFFKQASADGDHRCLLSFVSLAAFFPMWFLECARVYVIARSRFLCPRSRTYRMSSSPPAPRAGVIGEHGQALPPIKAQGGDKDKEVTGTRVQQQQQQDGEQQTQQAGEEYPRPSR